MKKNFTHISFVLDRSGSMGSIVESTISGFNKFIKEQKESNIGECVVSLHQFDNQYQTDYSMTPISEVRDLTTMTYQPRGATALNDAIGKTINELGTHLDSLNEDEKPDTVIVAILTDGYENASSEFTVQQINEMITHQTDKYNWEFLFLGANQDAIATASSYNIKAGNSLSFNADSVGNTHAYNSISQGILRKRLFKAQLYSQGVSESDAASMSSVVDTFNQEDRNNQNL